MKTALEMPIVGLVWNRYRKASATQDAVVEVRVYYQRKAKYMSTRIRLFPKEWKNGRVVNRVDAMILTKQLDQLIIDVRKVIYEMYEEGNIDIDAIPARLLAKRQRGSRMCPSSPSVKKEQRFESTARQMTVRSAMIGSCGSLENTERSRPSTT